MRITDDNAEMGARDSHLAGHVEFNGQAESCCQSRCGHITLGALWKIREDHLDEVQAPDRACSLKDLSQNATESAGTAAQHR